MIKRVAYCLAAPGAILLISGLTGCVFGPTSIEVGRGVYNEVINRTEDEQLLNMLVHDRYGETSGMLAVASVTATIRASANVSMDFGLSRSLKKDYDGNLVPLAAGVAFEENPTISYVPLGGEQFVRRLISPLSMEEVLSMERYLAGPQDVYTAVAISRINGISNPFATGAGPEFGTFRRVPVITVPVG